MKRAIILAATTLISTASFAQEAPPTAQGGMRPTAEKIRERQEQFFKDMDSNSDGAISKEESAAFAAKKFDERDANKDGKVTKDEWKAANEKKFSEWKEKHQSSDHKKHDGDKATKN